MALNRKEMCAMKLRPWQWISRIALVVVLSAMAVELWRLGGLSANQSSELNALRREPGGIAVKVV